MLRIGKIFLKYALISHQPKRNREEQGKARSRENSKDEGHSLGGGGRLWFEDNGV